MSLQIHELRIGNLFFWGSGLHYMEADDYMNMWVNGTGNARGEPITPRGLNQLGIRGIPMPGHYTYFKVELGEEYCLEFKFYGKDELARCEFNSDGCRGCDYPPKIDFKENGQLIYLHQLQNFYHAFTGQDLPVLSECPHHTGSWFDPSDYCDQCYSETKE